MRQGANSLIEAARQIIYRSRGQRLDASGNAGEVGENQGSESGAQNGATHRSSVPSSLSLLLQVTTHEFSHRPAAEEFRTMPGWHCTLTDSSLSSPGTEQNSCGCCGDHESGACMIAAPSGSWYGIWHAARSQSSRMERQLVHENAQSSSHMR